MRQIIRSTVSSQCLSVSLSTLSRSQFLTDFDKIWGKNRDALIGF